MAHGKSNMKPWILVLAVMVCTPISAQKAISDQLDVGVEPSDPIGATKRLMADELRDPDSAQYRFLGVHPARCKAGWANGKNGWVGYAASIDINAKNAMGGYVGFTTYTVLFQGDVAVRAVEGGNFGAYGPSKGLLGLGGGAGVCKYLD
mgnify:CR=1 FL=1